MYWHKQCLMSAGEAWLLMRSMRHSSFCLPSTQDSRGKLSAGLTTKLLTSSVQQSGIAALLLAFSASKSTQCRLHVSALRYQPQRYQPQHYQFWDQRRQAGAAAQPESTDEEITLTDNAIEVGLAIMFAKTVVHWNLLPLQQGCGALFQIMREIQEISP